MNGSTNTPPPTSSSTAQSSDKLSGQLIIKAQLGDDIRKMMIHNEDLTLNELVLMMQRIFDGKISNSDEVTIKYLDDDNDKITLLNDSDLTVALHFHKVLRLFVLVNGKEQLDNSNSTENANKEGSFIDANTFRNELQQIRNSIQKILDQLQLPTGNQQKDSSTTTITTTVPTPTTISNTAKEFDPYKHLQENQRSTTPDSIRSKSSYGRTFSTERKTFQQSPTSTIAPPSSVDNQQSFQSTESNDTNKQQTNTFQPTQMPTPHFVPTAFNNQQDKTSPYPPPPTTNFGVPTLPNANVTGYPATYPAPLPNSSAPPTFNPTSAPPLPPNAGQLSTFIGQQQTPAGPPPAQGGFYGQQQALMQQRSGLPAFGQQQQQTSAPPTSSSPATINPSFVQPSTMPTPPPMASQQPYGNYPPPPTNYFNPVQQYPKAT